MATPEPPETQLPPVAMAEQFRLTHVQVLEVDPADNPQINSPQLQLLLYGIPPYVVGPEGSVKLYVTFLTAGMGVQLGEGMAETATRLERGNIVATPEEARAAMQASDAAAALRHPPGPLNGGVARGGGDG
jgi:hypothetical protein